MFSRNYKEKTIESALFSVSALKVVILFLICLFLFRNSLLLFKETSLLDFLTGKFWYPTPVNRQFGLLPLFFGSLIGPSGCGKSTSIRCLNRMNDLIKNCRVEGEIPIEGCLRSAPTWNETSDRLESFQNPREKSTEDYITGRFG